MSNKNLFKEAIADAKAVREAALVNAKAALEEALTPRLQSMLATKLNEMEYEMEEEGYMGKDEEMEEGFTTSHGDDSDENLDFNLEEDEDLEEDFDLSEILAELNEAKEEKEEKEEDETIEKMSKQELEDFILDIIAQETGDGSKEVEMEPMDDMGGEEIKDSEEIDLEELLAELDEMGNDGEDLEEIDIKKVAGNVGKSLKSFGQNLRYAASDPKECRERAEVERQGALDDGFSAEQANNIANDILRACREEKGLGQRAPWEGPGTLSNRYNESQINESQIEREILKNTLQYYQKQKILNIKHRNQKI
jgi:hypothetical protein